MSKMGRFDVVVVGGGHAGTEAALAAARVGVKTLLITHNIETLGQMSCNPAIGGIGKSHLVKEVDALGGAMALATDLSGIHFRVLNRRKGPAVRATRAQADRVRYKQAIRTILENQPSLTIFQQNVIDLILQGEKVVGVRTSMNLDFYASTVVLTTGTFLGGKIHIGLENYAGGRAGESSSTLLAKRLREMPFRVDRLKTGTPPRIDGKTVDFSKLAEQPGDQPTPYMSYLGGVDQHPAQVTIYITETNEKTHDIIRSGLDRSPMYTGVIEGLGPRYCPSIEDKIVRFADKLSHQIFVEPEGLDTHELYPNGISTSLPFDVQLDLVRSMKGFEQANITRPGYAIEYDFFNPKDLKSSLETRFVEGLFFAGQINGTTGYEEAAAQGLVAGLNAARKSKDLAPWCPARDQAYIGVLIDDLITLGTNEPYRMFTSRAEYRLLLREDNADLRMTPVGKEMSIVCDQRWSRFCQKKEMIEAEVDRLSTTWVQPGSDQSKSIEAFLQKPLSREYSLMDLLKRPELAYQDLCGEQALADHEVCEQLEIRAKYQGYIARQEAEILRLKHNEEASLPDNMDYSLVRGLSNEVLQKLADIRPQTLGQASRIPGVTPAAVSLLLVYLKKKGLIYSDTRNSES